MCSQVVPGIPGLGIGFQLNTPHHQQGGTCYANAIATAIRATENRIIGRNPESHTSLVNKLVNKYPTGKHPDTYTVCRDECAQRQLKCRKIDENEAKKAVNENRVVIASFRLDDDQW